MNVVSTCPLPVASVVWQPRPGAWALTFVCKATFRLVPGVCELAEAQEDPVEHDGHWDDDETRSLGAASDLVPRKARADVLLVGHAFAPRQQPARVLLARLVVGAVDKSIAVWCDRVWHNGRLLEGAPFTRMPLRYERAAGGTANPVGLRFDDPPDAHGAVRIPNLQPPEARLQRWGDTFEPIGFGPLAPRWPGRVEKLRRHAAGWSPRAWRERPLPDDVDPAYFNAAPPDQQLASLEPDERIVLENLHPEHPRLETRLPGIAPQALMKSGGRAGEGIPLIADTLCIDTDRGLVTVVWRGRVPLVRPDEAGQVVVSTPGLGAGEVPGSTLALDDPSQIGHTVPILGGPRASPALPFGPAKSPWEIFRAAPPRADVKPAVGETIAVFGAGAPPRDALPFASEPRWTAPAVAPPAVPVAPPASAPVFGPPPPSVEGVRAVEAPARAVDVPVPAPVPVPVALSGPEPAAAPPVDEEIEGALSLGDYVAIRVALEDAPDPAEVLAARGVAAATWRKAHRAVTRRGLADPAFEARTRESLEQERRRAHAGRD